MHRVGRHGSPVPILLLAATTLIATPCSAETLNVLASFFSNPRGSGHTLFEQNHLFVVPRFDAALGTLDAISIAILRGAPDVPEPGTLVLLTLGMLGMRGRLWKGLTD